MGNSPIKTPSVPGKPLNSPNYGGEVILNESIATVYQRLLLDDKNLPRFTALL
jgi:hypothetical protein